jgi:phosphatidylethanolamine/phosphatidyl-N-methylethanolamine N-methyltransferase
MATDWALFLAAWMRHPIAVAAAIPSGPVLARVLGRLAGGRPQGAILELGAGTGSLTRGLLEAGYAEDRLVLLERDPSLVAVLRRKFPRALVIEGDAVRLRAHLSAHGITTLAGAVSSLPIKWFSLVDQAEIVLDALDLLGADGRFLQITNAFASPVAIAPLGLVGREVARVWLNFLPTQIWAYHRRR